MVHPSLCQQDVRPLSMYVVYMICLCGISAAKNVHGRDYVVLKAYDICPLYKRTLLQSYHGILFEDTHSIHRIFALISIHWYLILFYCTRFGVKLHVWIWFLRSMHNHIKAKAKNDYNLRLKNKLSDSPTENVWCTSFPTWPSFRTFVFIIGHFIRHFDLSVFKPGL